MAADTTNALPLDHDILPTARRHFLGEAVAFFTGCKPPRLLQNSRNSTITASGDRLGWLNNSFEDLPYVV
jgi:hypothetical protein